MDQKDPIADIFGTSDQQIQQQDERKQRRPSVESAVTTTSQSSTTSSDREAAEILSKHGVKPTVPVMPSRKLTQALRNQDSVIIDTNIHGITLVDAQVHRYDLTINTPLNNGRKIEWAKKIRSDYLTVDHRNHCRAAIQAFSNDNKSVISDANWYYHDLQSILYSTKPLNFQNASQPFKVTTTEGFGQPLYYSNFEITFKYVGELSLNDLGGASRDLQTANYDLEQFLNIASSHYSFLNPDEHVTFSSHNTYLINPGNYGFQAQDAEVFPELEAYLAIGGTKAAHIIEGRGQTKSDHRATGFVIQVKKTPFHNPHTPLDCKMELVLNQAPKNFTKEMVDKLNNKLRGLYIYCKHQTKGRNNPMRIQAIVSETALDKRFDMHDPPRKVTVKEYLENRYGLVLKKPHYPLVQFVGRDRSKIYLPPELVLLCDNQRVKTDQMLPMMTQKTIRKCAVPPFSLKKQNQQLVQSFNFGECMPLNMSVSERPIEVKARVLDYPPILISEDKEAYIVTNRGNSWSSPQFWQVGQIPSRQVWVVYGFLNRHDNRFNIQQINAFTDRFIRFAADRGLRLGCPADTGLQFGCNIDQMHEALQNAAKHNTYFALCLHDDTDDQMHSGIKLAEREFNIVTQCLKVGTVKNVLEKNQKQTLENILQKTNIKLGGQNYSLRVSSSGQSGESLDSETLYIGISSNYPGGAIAAPPAEKEEDSQADKSEGSSRAGGNPLPGGTPSVVGFAANLGVNTVNFMGDFVFQPCRRQESLEVIKEIIERCVNRFKEVRAADPAHLILFRNGLSEGQFKHVLKFEISLIRHVLTNMVTFEGGCTLTVIAVNKLQNVRFFQKNIDQRARAPDQNIVQGAVVDSTIVHPEYNQYYLNAHRTLQGTARIPLYTVLFDDADFAVEQLEKITYDLCYCHQIVYFPTSLPTPVYVANRYAERGRALYNRYVANYQPESFEELTQNLSYVNSEVQSRVRINA